VHAAKKVLEVVHTAALYTHDPAHKAMVARVEENFTKSPFEPGLFRTISLAGLEY
jgi:hypothetical protein